MMQAAQNVAQVFLGTNLKCASCHDSFVNEWTLADSHGLAAVFAEGPLEVHRCDKPTGESAAPAFIYPQLGTIDPDAPRAERMDRLAELITSPENGRLSRTIVNRLWAWFFGRGIVEPVDDMDQPAFCPELDVVSQGKTPEKAKASLREAIELFLETASLEEIRQAGLPRALFEVDG